MRKPALILAAAGLLIVALAIGLRFFAGIESTTSSPDASVVQVVDAGVVDAGGVDAGSDALDAGAEDAGIARSWDVNPEVRLSNGDWYVSAQEALNAADAGMTVFFPRGVYTQTLEVQRKKDLKLESEGGPAYFWLTEHAPTLLLVIESENISIRGFWLSRAGDPAASSLPNLLISNSTGVSVNQLVSEGASTCISVVQSSGVVLDEVSAFSCAGPGVSVVQATGDVTVARAKIHGTPLALNLTSPGAADAGSKVTVSQSILAATVMSGYPLGDVEIRSTVIATSSSSSDAVRRLVTPERVEVVALTAAVGPDDRKRMSDALAAGKVVLFSTVAAWGSDDFPDPPSTSFAWMAEVGDVELAHAAVTAAKEELVTEEPETGPKLVNVIDRELPICGRGDPIILYDEPGGETEVDRLPSCEELSNDIAMKPEMRTVTSQRGNWLAIGKGWMKKSDFATAEMIEHGGYLIALPVYEAQIVSVKGQTLEIVGDSDACMRATCHYEGEGESTEPPAEPSPKNSERTIELPDGLTLPPEARVQQLFTAACCT